MRTRGLVLNQRAYGTPLERLERGQRMRAALRRACAEPVAAAANASPPAPKLYWREETIEEFAARMGLHKNSVSRKLHLPNCPQNFEAVEGPTGRIMKLRASRDLEDFMKEGKAA